MTAEFSIDLLVCVTCQDGDKRPGMELHDALVDKLDQRIRLRKVECFAICKRPCTVAVSSPGKWTYMIGDLNIDTDIGALLEYVDAYAKSPDGTPPFKERPAAIRRGTLARLPPLSE